MRLADRIELGTSGLRVSPVCVGICGSAEVPLAAYDAGINFFFVSSDLHWPLYENLRSGLATLFRTRPDSRSQVVVAVVSYLSQPLFSSLQFQEVVTAVPGMERPDVLVAGACWGLPDYLARSSVVRRASQMRYLAASCSGASFHSRAALRHALEEAEIDVAFVRLNSRHPESAEVLGSRSRSDGPPVFAFTSRLSCLESHGLASPADGWIPDATDYYRFALTQQGVDGVLCALGSRRHLSELVAAVERGPLSEAQQRRMIELASSRLPQLFESS